MLVLAGLVFGPVWSEAADDTARSPLEVYHAAGQALLHDQIAPQLRRAAPTAGSPRDVEIAVTASRDPLDLTAEIDPAGTRRLRVSAGFLVFLDSLVDAEVAARLLNREDLLAAYRDDVVRYAGVATRTRPGLANPGRFFRRLGLSKAEYDTLFASRVYQDSRSNNMVQSLAWIAAHRLIVGINDGGSSDATAANRATARWAWAADFAPFPLPGAAMLYFAGLDPSVSDTALLRCRAQKALLASVNETRAARLIPGRLPRPVSEAQMNLWAAVASATAPAGSCADTEESEATHGTLDPLKHRLGSLLSIGLDAGPLKARRSTRTREEGRVPAGVATPGLSAGVRGTGVDEAIALSLLPAACASADSMPSRSQTS
jgi:hypothetical protein